ncbi:MAG: hypothetical protein IT306_08310 [Chloroflexi bacterium]|nr:hypothetical protein [Chloroflexota bacterium]
MRAAGLALAWAVAEATVWPIMPDALTVPLALRRPSHWWQLVLGAVLGTILGGAISHLDGRARPERAHTERLPLVRPPMVTAATRWLRESGPRGALRQAATGVPVKVFARTAGSEGLPLASFLAWAAVGRAARFGLLTGVAALLGRAFPDLVAQRYWLFAALWAGGFGLALWRMVRFWERQPAE